MKTVALIALVLASASPVWAQSLLQGERSPNDPPKKPSLQKHDHVQITFAEPAKQGAGPDAERRVRWDKELRDWVRNDAKDGATGMTVAAEVVDVRPNGALVLQAVKRRIVNKDEEVVRMTCEVAAEHVMQNKTTSDHLVNLTMTYDGAGVDGAKPGLLGWLFGRIWPF
jgi:hypothetical protein